MVRKRAFEQCNQFRNKYEDPEALQKYKVLQAKKFEK